MIADNLSIDGKPFLTEEQLSQFNRQFSDSDLTAIAEKLRRGEALNSADGLMLFESLDIHAIGFLANAMRHNYHGNTTWYVINRHINYSNLCQEICLFCSFSRDTLDKSESYEMDLKTVLALRLK